MRLSGLKLGSFRYDSCGAQGTIRVGRKEQGKWERVLGVLGLLKSYTKSIS